MSGQASEIISLYRSEALVALFMQTPDGWAWHVDNDIHLTHRLRVGTIDGEEFAPANWIMA